MKQLKNLLVFIVAMTVFIILLFMINDKKEDTEYSDVFFGFNLLIEMESQSSPNGNSTDIS